MTALTVALDRRDWSLASLYLLLGVSEAASHLPPESLEALLDLLTEAFPEEAGPRRATIRGRKR